MESEPEFAITQCGSTLDTERTCSYERLKHMKTKWVPSLSYAGHYPAVTKFFAQKGITVRGSRSNGGLVRGRGGGSLHAYCSRRSSGTRRLTPSACAAQTHGFIEWATPKDTEA